MSILYISDVDTWQKQCPKCLNRYAQLQLHLRTIHCYSSEKAYEAVAQSIASQLAVVPTTSRSNLYTYVPADVGRTIILQIECFLQSLGHSINENVPLPDTEGPNCGSEHGQVSSVYQGQITDEDDYDKSNVESKSDEESENNESENEQNKSDSESMLDRSDESMITNDLDASVKSKTPNTATMTKELRQRAGLSNKVLWNASGTLGCSHLHGFYTYLIQQKAKTIYATGCVNMVAKLFYYLQDQMQTDKLMADPKALQRVDLVSRFYDKLACGLSPIEGKAIGLQPSSLMKEIDGFRRYLSFLLHIMDANDEQNESLIRKVMAYSLKQ